MGAPQGGEQVTVGHTPSGKQYYDPASSGVLSPTHHSFVRYTNNPTEPSQEQAALVPYTAPPQQQAYLPPIPPVPTSPTLKTSPFKSLDSPSPYTALPMQEVPASSKGVGIVPLHER